MSVSYQIFFREVETNDQILDPITVISDKVFEAAAVFGSNDTDRAKGTPAHEYVLKFLTTQGCVFKPFDPAIPVGAKVTEWYEAVGGGPSDETGVGISVFSLVADAYLDGAPILLNCPVLKPDKPGDIWLTTTKPKWASTEVTASNAVKKVGTITPQGRSISYLTEVDYRFEQYVVLSTTDHGKRKPDVKVEQGDPRTLRVEAHASASVLAIYDAEEIGGTFTPHLPILHHVWDDPRLWRVIAIIADHPEAVAGLDRASREYLTKTLASAEAEFTGDSLRLAGSLHKALHVLAKTATLKKPKKRI